MGFLRKISQRALLPAAFALFFGAFAAPANAEDLTVIQFSSVGGITDAPLYLAEEYGLFTKAGLKVERQRMTSAPNLMTAVATGQVDAAGISITPGLYSSVQQGVHMRIVGDKQSLSPGISATRLVIRSDLSTGTEAGDMKVLKGKKIAISAKASSVNMLLASLLKKYGMTFADVQVIELSYPNMMPALASKAIDGAIDLEPFMSQALQGGVAKVVSDLTEFVPEHGAVIVPIVYSEDFARKTKLANAFMRAYMQGVRIYNDAMVKGKDTEKAIDIIARYAKVKPEIVRDSFPAGMDPNQRISLPFLEELQTFFVKEKFLRDKIDVNKIVDLSFADAAVKELGTYK